MLDNKGGFITVKKWLIGLLVVVFTMTCSWSIYANPGSFHKGPPLGPQHGPKEGPHDDFQNNRRDRELQDDSRYVIHRTAQVIFEAQRAAERGHRPFGLGRAVFAQQRARQLYMNGNYQDAIAFSMRARRIAIDVIQANHFRVRSEFFADRVESRYDHQGPSDAEVDRRMDDHREKMGRDDDAVRIHIELDL